ncbi:MAG: DnaJ domain-containing protein [Nitrospiraceae bacterium]|nr:DnaJ domain-containing protein [Nitrospiraceae bacterium]
MSEKDSRRDYKRYLSKSDFSTKINGKTVKGELKDYSLDGIGVFLYNSPPIEKGSLVEIDIDSPAIYAKGEIKWTAPSDSGIALGLKRIEFPRKGNLKDYFLADIFLGMQRCGVTGTFEVEKEDTLKKIYISNGDIIFASSNLHADRLGEFLFKIRKINIEQYKNYIAEIQTSKRKEGALLVELGCINSKDIPEMVRRMAEEIVFSTFNFNDAEFKFIEGTLPLEEVISLKLSTGNIIYQGVKRFVNPQKHFQSLKISLESVMGFSEDPLDLFQKVNIEGIERKIFSLVNGERTIKEIISISSINDIIVLRTLYALLSARIIELKNNNGINTGVSAGDVIDEQDQIVDENFFKKVDKIYSSYEREGYYGVLQLNKWADSNEIKKAYYKAAKEFHPDKHLHLKSDSLKEKLNTIFTYITEAYTILANPQKKAEYDMRSDDKHSGTADNVAMAKVKFEQGRIEFRKGNYSVSFQLFGQSVYLDNKVPEYHFYYGLCLLKMGRHKEAERAISRASEKSPQNHEYLTELGYVFLLLNFPKRAKTNFEKALRINPSNARAVEGLRKAEEMDAGN